MTKCPERDGAQWAGTSVCGLRARSGRGRGAALGEWRLGFRRASLAGAGREGDSDDRGSSLPGPHDVRVQWCRVPASTPLTAFYTQRGRGAGAGGDVPAQSRVPAWPNGRPALPWGTGVGKDLGPGTCGL